MQTIKHFSAGFCSLVQVSIFIPQELLIVNGARHHAGTIQHLIKLNAKGALSYDCDAVLENEPNNKFDQNAIAVLVDHLRVGYISAEKAPSLKRIILDSYNVLRCTLLWNGDPDSDYSLYTVQLFNVGELSRTQRDQTLRRKRRAPTQQLQDQFGDV